MKLWLSIDGKRKAYQMKLDERGRLVPDSDRRNHVWENDSREAKRACILAATPEERAALTAAGFQIPDCPPERIMGHRGGSSKGPEKARGDSAYYRALGRKGLDALHGKPSNPVDAPKLPTCPTCGCLIDLHTRGYEGEARCGRHDQLCGWLISGRA